jgi:uncharacterized protein YjdB
MRKIYISFLTALCFCAFTNKANAAWPGAGTAGNPWQIGDGQTNTVSAVKAKLQGDTLLTIFGTGNMADFLYSTEGQTPWRQAGKHTLIKTIVIESGITNIGDVAFLDCNNLNYIDIAEGVTIIGTRAFENCTSLYAIIIPSSTVTIENQAFYNCTGLLSIANMRNTPQNISNNVFQGVTISNIYLVTPKEATTTYQSTNVWSNFKYVAPYVLISGNLGNAADEAVIGLDGSAIYFEYQGNNSNIPKQLTAYDGVSDKIETIVSFNNDGFPDRIFRDNTVFVIDRIDNNTCNIYSTDSEGNSRNKSGIVFNIPWSAKDARELATNWAGTILDAIVKNSNELLVENTAPDWIGLTELIIGTLGIDDFMPPSVKAIYTGYMSAFSIVGTLTSCGNMIFFASTGVGLPLAFLSSAACVASVYNLLHNYDDFRKALAALHGNNTNTGCSVTATLYGGTLIISGSGALCTAEINKFSDRKSEITKLVICGGVTSIPDAVFLEYTNLTSVSIGNGVKSIGWAAFAKTGLYSVSIPSSVVSIKNEAFAVCKNLTDVSFENGNETLTLGTQTGAAYPGCVIFHDSPIETLRIRRNLNYLTGWGSTKTFQNSTALTTLIRGGSATSTYEFFGCLNLTSVILENSVTSIGDNCFSDLTSLTSIDFGNGLVSIGSSAFKNCSNVTDLNFPNTLTSIGSTAFYNCGMPKVTIPTSVTSIGNQAFQSCANLKEVTIQDSDTKLRFIGSSINFSGSPIEILYLGRNLESAYISGNYSNGNPFSSNTSLKTLTIGNDVTIINANSFNGCSGLTEITNKNPTPPQVYNSDSFKNVSRTACKLYVPIGFLSAYKEAAVWKEFYSINEEGNTTVAVTSVTLQPTTTSLSVGNTQQLTATVLPANATNKTVTWSSSNTSVATVSTTGLVTAKAAGTATITVTTADGSKKATCAITVTSSTGSGISVDDITANPTTVGSLFQSFEITVTNLRVRDETGIGERRVGIALYNSTGSTEVGYSPARINFNLGVGWGWSSFPFGATLSDFSLTSMPANGTYRIYPVVSSNLSTYRPYTFLRGADGSDKYVTITVLSDNTAIETTKATEGLRIYPNPVSDELYIQYEKPIDKIEVLDITGRHIIIDNVQSTNDHAIHVSGLLRGIYFVRIFSGNQIITKKIIKQ